MSTIPLFSILIGESFLLKSPTDSQEEAYIMTAINPIGPFFNLTRAHDKKTVSLSGSEWKVTKLEAPGFTSVAIGAILLALK